MNNTHNIDTAQTIDRLISMLDKNIDRLIGDMPVAKAIEVICMLQDMREHEVNYNKKTHTAE